MVSASHRGLMGLFSAPSPPRPLSDGPRRPSRAGPLDRRADTARTSGWFSFGRGLACSPCGSEEMPYARPTDRFTLAPSPDRPRELAGNVDLGTAWAWLAGWAACVGDDERIGHSVAAMVHGWGGGLAAVSLAATTARGRRE